MPIRGKRNFLPMRGGAPTGIFSSHGTQKMDDTGRFSHKVDLNYSKGSSTRSRPKSTMGDGVRHQPPRTLAQKKRM